MSLTFWNQRRKRAKMQEKNISKQQEHLKQEIQEKDIMKQQKKKKG